MEKTSRAEIEPQRRQRSIVTRVGWSVAGVGLLVTVVGTGILGAGARSLEDTGDWLRTSGLLIALGGFAIVLSSARARQPPLREPPRRRHWAPAASRTPQPAKPNHHRINRAALIVLGITIGGVIGLQLIIPPRIAPLYFRNSTAAIVSVLLILSIYDRGLLRSFCIAALPPAIALLLSAINDPFGLFFGPFRPWRNDFELLDFEFNTLGILFVVCVQWGVVGMIGLLGVCVRLMIDVGRPSIDA